MFVQTLKTLKMGTVYMSGLVLLTVSGGVPAFAAEAHTPKASIDLTIDGVIINDAPLYISVQKQEDYMTDGYTDGAIIPTPAAATITQILSVPAGDYAVSLWHDLDKDGAFTRAADYHPLDGWGSSGTMPTTRPPVFDDVKVTVPEGGLSLRINMVYPEK